MSMNKVFLVGRLGQDPELKYTPTQVAVCTLNVATTEYAKGSDGQKKEITEWHRVVVFGKSAENCSTYLAKGSMVGVDGKLRTRSWEDQSGQKRYVTEIVTDNVQFLSSKKEGAAQPAANQAKSAPQAARSAGAGFPQNTAPAHNQHQIDAGYAAAQMDDIPF